jgi:hypothetical protein
VASALLLAAANAPWLSVALRDEGGVLEVGGAAAAPALNGLALACIACVGAAALAPRVLRYVLAGILAILGAATIVVAAAAVADPLGAAERTVSTVTGVSGRESVSALVSGIAPTWWPGVAIVAGAALVLLAGAVAASARRWPGARRRFGGSGPAAADATPADTWDALSRGTDPTRGSGDGPDEDRR